jgi:hypothetical protein
MYILDFFDHEKECLDSLKELKEQYFEEASDLESSCGGCEIRQIRDKYLEILLNHEAFTNI